MATKNMAYDHPQYLVNVGAHGVMQLTAIAGRQVAFVAYGDAFVRAVHWNPLVGGTNTAAGNVGHLLGIHVRNGTGVASGTATLIAAGDYGTALTGTTVLVTTTLSRGDTYKVVNTGTDATGIFSIGIEGQLVPGANVTS